MAEQIKKLVLAVGGIAVLLVCLWVLRRLSRALEDELDDLRAARRAGRAYEEWKKDPSRGMTLEQSEAELVAEGLLDAQAARDALAAYQAGETIPWEQVKGLFK